MKFFYIQCVILFLPTVLSMRKRALAKETILFLGVCVVFRDLELI